eukprot:scaffold124095_cov33-Phaeocystis_antarctica.AAC.1
MGLQPWGLRGLGRWRAVVHAASTAAEDASSSACISTGSSACSLTNSASSLVRTCRSNCPVQRASLPTTLPSSFLCSIFRCFRSLVMSFVRSFW